MDFRMSNENKIKLVTGVAGIPTSVLHKIPCVLTVQAAF